MDFGLGLSLVFLSFSKLKVAAPGELGPDRRDIYDGFNPTESPTAYPAFWGHDTGAVSSLTQTPNRYLTPLAQAKSGRPLRRVEDLWPKAGRILIAEGIRLNTNRLNTVYVSTPVLSNVWWPLVLNEDLQDVKYEKALTLWCNSTLGLIQMLARREDTMGAWVGFKKPALTALPVLDLRQLSAEQINTLASAYDRLAEQTLQPLPAMAEDKVRAARGHCHKLAKIYG